MACSTQLTPIESAGGCSASSCGGSEDQLGSGGPVCGERAGRPEPLAGLPEHIRDQVRDHPCYSEKAHHHFARMHVAVAPACNIQCNYCNRKYDCSNESRPGVVSEVLTPDQAVRKVKAVAAEIPQMTVVGIAGPGDAMANPERTFETFRRLAAETPDIKLCVSTNGLNLPEHVEELAKYNISHVTLTINAIDPEIGAKIYPWIFWNHRRIRGVKGARILLEQQMKSLELLAEKGVLVKVNSVMIPGVNDQHLKEVNQAVKARGAFLHNIMPLIAEAEHGTYYGVMEHPSPSDAELASLQDACAGDMNMMRHCRQCRADAVGMLGEDRGSEFTTEKVELMEIDYGAAMERRAKVHEEIKQRMDDNAAVAVISLDQLKRSAPQVATRPALIAVATKGFGVVNEHFGYAKEFLVYEASPEGVRFIGPRQATNYCTGSDECGAESRLDQIIRSLDGCEAVLCSRVGLEPWTGLEAAGIQPMVEFAMEEIDAAVAKAYRTLAESGKLAESAAHASVA
ncbi:nitrogenase cofactor biosynthesis protein NifB [Endothiovibrio diazotrophicus]